ncbi:DUF6378 domain-containing protein [Kineococcus sp. NPDC059986]|uniref:DUF6378 domain-containing protein n=1 Tax=Kineococcus sp. NPDC059986 TaxID=3155538 RepID=UPI00344B49FE
MSETVAAQALTPRSRVLQTADDAIHGDRNTHYGTPTENFERISKLWSVYLGRNVSPRDVAMLMILLKVARGMNLLTEDTMVDIAGYAACGWECETQVVA